MIRHAESYGMANNVTELDDCGGTVVLRGIKIEVDSDIGAAFVVDCCRHIEDLITADALRAKYGLLDDDAYAALGANEPLQLAIAAAKTRRIHDGSAAREKAQHAFLAAPSILDGIMNDSSASPRHRIEAVRELRQVAAVGPTDTQAAQKERFVININFGSNKLRKEIELKPVAPERETLAIEHDDEREEEYGF
jgi:hypothetical protein